MPSAFLYAKRGASLKITIVSTPSARRFPEGIPRGPPGLMKQTGTPVFTALPGGFQPVSASGMSLSRVQSIIVG